MGGLTTGPLILVVDGAEALERLRERRPALIIVDPLMPVMDGRTFIAAKNRDPTIAQIPILIATAEPQVNVEGVTVFMRKPFDLMTPVAEPLPKGQR